MYCVCNIFLLPNYKTNYVLILNTFWNCYPIVFLMKDKRKMYRFQMYVFVLVVHSVYSKGSSTPPVKFNYMWFIHFSTFSVPLCPSKHQVYAALFWTCPHPLPFFLVLAQFSLFPHILPNAIFPFSYRYSTFSLCQSLVLLRLRDSLNLTTGYL